MRTITLLLIILTFVFDTKAKVADQLINYVPKDSVILMLYYNQENFDNDSILNVFKNQMSETSSGIFNNCKEFCFYVQDFELYSSYTVHFRIDGDVDLQNANIFLENMNLNLKSFEGGFWELEGKERKDGRYGYLYKGDNYYTLQVYAQTMIVDEKLRAECEQLKSGITEYTDEIEQKGDSLMQLDAVESKKYFNALLLAQKKKIQNGEDFKHIKKTLRFNKEIAGNIHAKAIVAYAKPANIEQLPWHFIRFTNNFDLHDYLEKATALKAYSASDQLWITMAIDKAQIHVETVHENKKKRQEIYKKIDKDILKYLPVTHPETFSVHNVSLVELVQQIIEGYPSFSKDNMYGAAVKMGLLVIDDQLISGLGNGFITSKSEGLLGSDVPDFKMVFKVPETKKSQLLLEIMCNDLGWLEYVENNCFTIFKEKRIKLFVQDDIWIIGSGKLNDIKTRLSKNEVKSLYPKLKDKKLAQYSILPDFLLDEFDIPLKSVEAKTSIINRKTVKAHIQIKLKDE